MKINFSIEEAVGKRVSVRNYTNQPIEDEKRAMLTNFLQELDNPYNQKVNFHFFDIDKSSEDQKLGTYGVIQKAKHFMGASIKPVPRALEALGYEMETIMLFLAHLDVGTCWLGGTFDRKSFSLALQVSEDEILPAITPIGYAQSSRHLQEVLMRTFVQAHKRLEWSKLFFNNDFQTVLSKEQANGYEFALEMVRLAPSASNKQPWRILLKDGIVHFYEYKTPKYSDSFGYDIQRIDMGIAAAHFEYSVKELGMSGNFVWNLEPKVELPQHMEYVFSWVKQ